MKIRTSYVSNSSSSSFILLKSAINQEQRDMILSCKKYVEKFIKLEKQGRKLPFNVPLSDTDFPVKLAELFEYYNEEWNFRENSNYIFGWTSMDNFRIRAFLEYIGVNMKYTVWSDGMWDDEPTKKQLRFIDKLIKEERKKKIDKLNGL